MTELGQWVAGWLERLTRAGGSPGRDLVLHDTAWGPIDPRQVNEQLRLLRQPGPADQRRHGNCAVAFEAPWQGRPALWIEAASYQHGMRREEITLVRALSGHGPAVPVRGGASSRPPVPAADQLAGPPPGRPAGRHPGRPAGPRPTRPPRAHAVGHPQGLPTPMLSPRGTFWLWFFLCFLWPLLLVVLIIDFRRAEARGDSGGRYARGALFGTLLSAALSAVIILLGWLVLLAGMR